ncbi:uncharacterized protein At5g01610-like [Bidens hawaiensis]|uniref:uncharacterized protein At5g01610-like n=1 Tax=Bidens hawaiensis TaxID=980011 RepID=UPI00404AC2AD
MALYKPNMETLEMMLLCFTLSLIFSFTEGGDEPSVYQILQSYNLPVGLLPNGAYGYTFDPRSGRYSVNLRTICEVNVGGYEFQYSPPITGVISQNNLGEMGGVKVKVALGWVSIVNINRNQDQLKLTIHGIGDKEFPVNVFYLSPNCKQL